MIDYNAFVREQLRSMPLRQLAMKIGATPLTVSRWRDGHAVSYKYKLVLDAMEREQHERFYRAIVRGSEDMQGGV